MAQYQARTGPITNQAAAFSPEMAAGAMGSNSRPRDSRGKQIGQPLLPVTFAAAPFAPPMASGAQGHVFKSLIRAAANRIDTLTNPPIFSTFAFESVAGCKPDRARIWQAPRIPQPLSQTTHVASAFSVEMPAGAIGSNIRPRNGSGKQIQPPFLVQVADFSFESVLASSLGFRSAWKRIAPIQQLVPEAIHDPATFSIEMADGASGGSTARPRDRQMQRPFFADVAPPFPFESVAGYQPSRPRLFLAPRIGLPISETTPINAPISIEMFAGQVPSTRRWSFSHQIAQPFVIHVSIFDFETIFGCKPDSPRLFRKNTEFQTAFGTFQFSHQPVSFSPEMSAGAVGSNIRRIASPGSQWGQTLAQPTHVSAPFSLEMIAGNIPLRYRWKPSTRFQQPFLDLATVFNVLNAMSRTSTRAVDLPYSTWLINLPYSTEQE